MRLRGFIMTDSEQSGRAFLLHFSLSVQNCHQRNYSAEDFDVIRGGNEERQGWEWCEVEGKFESGDWTSEVHGLKSADCSLATPRALWQSLTLRSTSLYSGVLRYTLLYFAMLCCTLLDWDWLSVCSLVSCSALGLYYPDPAVLQAELQTLNPVLCTSPAPLSRPDPAAMIFLCIEDPFPKGLPQNQSAYQIGDFELILVPRLFWKHILEEAAVVFSNGFWY